MLTAVQSGLPTIISRLRGSNLSKGQIDELIERAQWFYYARSVRPMFSVRTLNRLRTQSIEQTWEQYNEWRTGRDKAVPSSSVKDQQAAGRLVTFNLRPLTGGEPDETASEQ